MKRKHNIAERQAKAKFAMGARLAGSSFARNGAVDPRESIMERIAEQRALRLARKPKSEPPI
jgi:hypothetical protein